MNKPIFLSFLVILILCINQAQGITVINSRYSSALSVGERDTFSMIMKPDTLAEIGIPLTVSMDGGNCSEWVKLDTKEIILKDTGTTVTASITVPKDAYNSFYQCYVQFTGPTMGMITSRIQVPISINTSGGTVAPVPTATATSTPEMKAPTQEPEIPVVPVAAVVKPTGETAPIPAFPYGLATAGCIAAAFLIVIAYDYQRGKRKVKK